MYVAGPAQKSDPGARTPSYWRGNGHSLTAAKFDLPVDVQYAIENITQEN